MTYRNGKCHLSTWQKIGLASINVVVTGLSALNSKCVDAHVMPKKCSNCKMLERKTVLGVMTGKIMSVKLTMLVVQDQWKQPTQKKCFIQ